jgi:hypothetical protein
MCVCVCGFCITAAKKKNQKTIWKKKRKENRYILMTLNLKGFHFLHFNSRVLFLFLLFFFLAVLVVSLKKLFVFFFVFLLSLLTKKQTPACRARSLGIKYRRAVRGLAKRLDRCLFFLIFVPIQPNFTTHIYNTHRKHSK